MNDEWITLRRVNDWGHVGFYMPNDDVLLTFNALDVISVRFPDGTQQSASVLMRKEGNKVSERGHTEIVISEIAYIRVNAHGLFLDVPLDKVQVLSSEIMSHRKLP